VKENFAEYENKNIILAGRIIKWRSMGKIIFAEIEDATGPIQILLRKDDLKSKPPEGLGFEEIKFLDLYDFVQVSGKIGKTQAGEITLFVESLILLSKTLRPRPNTLTDKEARYRRRYLDMSMNPSVRMLFERKSRFWNSIRNTLTSDGFTEIYLPVLEHTTGGADAKPFITHHNALDEELFLRISLELYSKRAIGAGYEKVFSIGPVFRNEGMSDEHANEFNHIEWYWAYADYKDQMQLTRKVIMEVAKAVYGKTDFETRGHKFDLSSEWKEIDYTSIIKEKFDIDVFTSSDEDIKKKLEENNLHLEGAVNRQRMIDNLWKLIRKNISGPAFLVNEPAFMSPLAKPVASNPKVTERFHVIIAGTELANGYTEINDPIYQLDQFQAQQNLRDSGDEEAQMLDIDFVEMLEYGMPPTTGLGFSERLFWFLEDISAREGTMFPQLKVDFDTSTKKIYSNVNFGVKKIYEDLKENKYFSISDNAKIMWPSLHIGVAVIRDINISKTHPDLENAKSEILAIYKDLKPEDINHFTEIQSYRKMYKEMGVDWHSRRPSPEALLRRIAQKKDLYSINTCVDAYNLIVMKHRVSAGAFDIDQISLPTVLRLGVAGEKIHLLGDKEETTVTDKEIVYADKLGAYNLDFNYRDAQRTAVTENTKNILINVDGVHSISREQVEKTLKEIIADITKYCGGKVEMVGIVSS
ncbi:MAG: amino acid--tRNA ligase-related protein, partial [Patescibacteria group bacterium]